MSTPDQTDSGMRAGVRWFVVLVEEQNVTAAAARLRMAQPTLSRMLSRLERRLGTPLFDRRGRRIEVNQAGRELAAHLRRADAEIAAGEAAVAGYAATSPTPIRLGFLHSFGTWLVPALIRQQHEQLPGVRFELTQGAADSIANGVQLGQLDVGIVSPRPTIPGLAWRRLLRQRLRLAVPTSHRLARRDTVRLETLVDEAFLSMSAGFGMRAILEDLCAAAGFAPQIAVECQELTTVAALVGAGLGIAVLPVEEVPVLPAGVSLVNIADADAVRDIGIVWQPHPTEQTRDFIGLAGAVTASLGQ